MTMSKPRFFTAAKPRDHSKSIGHRLLLLIRGLKPHIDLLEGPNIKSSFCLEFMKSISCCLLTAPPYPCHWHGYPCHTRIEANLNNHLLIGCPWGVSGSLRPTKAVSRVINSSVNTVARIESSCQTLLHMCWFHCRASCLMILEISNNRPTQPRTRI